MRKSIVLTTAVLALAAAASVLPAVAAEADPPCVMNCVVTFPVGAETTWIVPTNASDVSVVVAAGAGGTNTYSGSVGGSGGQVTVDLGTNYNGQTLHVVAGDVGPSVSTSAPGGGGGGSFVAGPSGFIVIAGGGAGAGAVSATPMDQSQPGGNGGFSTASADGSKGTNKAGFSAAGFGAIGVTPGTASTTPGLLGYGGSGTASSVAPDGAITPGIGGDPAVGGGFPDGQGGGGYAGGGGGSMEQTVNDASAGAGGGGSGYLAPGLVANATAANTGAGSVVFTYSLQPTIAAPAASVAVGTTSTTTVSTLPASTAFTVVLSGSNTQVGAGTIDPNGDPATVTFTVPAGADAGSHTLNLVVGGATVATSPAFTVTAVATAGVLAATGVTEPWWVVPAAGSLSVVGLFLVLVGKLRRRTTN